MAPVITPFLKSSLEGAQASIHCAAADDTDLSNGAYYERCKAKKLSATACDEGLAQELWERSLTMTGCENI